MNSMHFSRNIHRINFLLIILDQANANTTPSAADVEVTEIYSSTPPQNVISSDPSTSTSQDQQNNVTTVQKPKLTPKQDELNKMVNIENEILVSLYRKQNLGQASDSDRKEISARQKELNGLKKQLKETIQNAAPQKKLRDERKRKLENIDETICKKLMGKATSGLDWPEECDKPELIKAISRIALSGSAVLERRRNEVIQTVKTLDQLTEALNREGFELK